VKHRVSNKAKFAVSDGVVLDIEDEPRTPPPAQEKIRELTTAIS